MRRRFVLPMLVIVGTVAAMTVAPLGAGDNPSGFKTSQPSMLVLGPGAPANSSVEPIITVGETLPGGYRFEAIPDGISVRARGQGRVDLYVNHETSRVPFPYNPTLTVSDPGESQNDFDNAQVSHLVLNQHSGGVLSGKLAITGSEGFQRFCSNYLATGKEGFDRPILFTNEEAQDWVFRTTNAWPGPGFIAPATPGAEQPGAVVTYDPQTGKHTPIYGMGRFNHENSVAIPGFGKPVVVSGDDPFSTTPASSQLYLYVADDTGDLLADKGTLYAFSATDASKNDYFDVQPGDAPVAGTFIPVPKNIATGKDPGDGHELTQAVDFPSYAGPPSGTPDGPQWVLDQWGNAANNSFGKDVFDFIRIEDTAYDKGTGMSNVVYLADSGRATSGSAAPTTKSTNGRVWKLEFTDPEDPTKAQISVVIQGDDQATKAPDEIHQPDNLETTANGSLFVLEDPSTNNQFAYPSADANRTSARIWRLDLNAAQSSSNPSVVARIPTDAANQKHLGDEDSGDLDPADNPPFVGGAFPLSPGNLGAWESSGLVDASSVFGDGAFLVDVQAHTYWVDSGPGEIDAVAPFGSPDFLNKREGGQLLLLRLPGA